MGAQPDASFKRMWEVATASDGNEIQYDSNQPKVSFLSYLLQEQGVLLHGSGKANLTALTPLQATGVPSDQALKAVYATDSAAEAIFFAVLRRADVGSFSSTTYGDAYTVEVFGKRAPWQLGVVYVLPRDKFVQASGYWVSRQVVSPMTSLKVEPEDFPYLRSVQLSHLPWYDKWIFLLVTLWKYRR